ncbi:MAG TPA: D-isomer specific 2-hydroxyacid dehydrogenase family protein [Streptosporangiaceae bacterium]
MTEMRIAVGPSRIKSVDDAIRQGGGQPADADAAATGLVWLSPWDADGLRVAIGATGARWVQLSVAGVEVAAAAGLLTPAQTWTSAKGAFAEPVAEHALTLALAGLRMLPERIEARSWGQPGGTSLYDERVTILGGGGIATSLLQLLAPFRVTATVVRRTAEPVPGAARTVPTSRLTEALADAQVVFLALALTPETERIIGVPQLAAMRRDSWLVNVGRGRLVDTDSLVAALDSGTIAGAALDVTDPEPLPDGHPLWEQPRCIITPHTADTPEMVARPLAFRIQDNVARFVAGEPLVGVIDTAAGY